MTQIAKQSSGMPDFVEARHRYEKMTPGDRAQLGKRMGTADDLALVPAFYKLFPGVAPSHRHRQVAFLIPWCRHSGSAAPIGRAIAAKGVNEKRLLQVVRSQSPSDLVYLRRLLQAAEIVVDWSEFGKAVYFWNDNDIARRQLVEQYFIARHGAGKGE